jgi:hypothetical protein
MAAEQVGADDLLHPGRQPVEPGAQIDRVVAGQEKLRASVDYKGEALETRLARPAVNWMPARLRR